MKAFASDIAAFQAGHRFEYINVEGIPFRYLLCGEGKTTLTLLTGGMGLAELNFSFIEKLEEHYRVLTFDYPMGLDTNAALADAVHALLEQLGIEKTIFVGESFGGYLAQIIARKYPNITEGLCLFSTAGLNANTVTSLKKKYARIARPMLWVLGHIPYAWLKPTLIKASLRHITQATDDELQYMREFFTWAFKYYTGAFDVHMTSLLIDIMNQTPCRKEEFNYLKGRVMLILPDDDGTFTPQMQRELIALFEEPTVVEHISGGHLAPILQTGTYVAAIRDFVNSRFEK